MGFVAQITAEHRRQAREAVARFGVVVKKRPHILCRMGDEAFVGISGTDAIETAVSEITKALATADAVRGRISAPAPMHFASGLYVGEVVRCTECGALAMAEAPSPPCECGRPLAVYVFRHIEAP